MPAVVDRSADGGIADRNGGDTVVVFRTPRG
jgi:hypothetical protein